MTDTSKIAVNMPVYADDDISKVGLVLRTGIESNLTLVRWSRDQAVWIETNRLKPAED